MPSRNDTPKVTTDDIIRGPWCCETLLGTQPS